MKALGYLQAHAVADFSLREFDLPVPEPGPLDVLVRIKAVSLNPVDTKVRASRSATSTRPVILGWDAAGVIERIGGKVTGFKPGDEVFYAGDLLRDGSNAEYQIVDHRVIALKPAHLSFTDAAAIPLTALTAWEALIERDHGLTAESNVLIIGGAGGVGSIAIQLLKAATPVRVIATASRPETIAWCHDLGADVVINHHHGLDAGLKEHGLSTVDLIFGTTHSDAYLKIIPDLLRPFGHFCLIDDPKALDIVGFKRKAINVHWEFMFAKTMFHYREETQGQILRQVAQLTEVGKIKSTAKLVLSGLTVDNLRLAHTRLEAAESIGKIVIEL